MMNPIVRPIASNLFKRSRHPIQQYYHHNISRTISSTSQQHSKWQQDANGQHSRGNRYTYYAAALLGAGLVGSLTAYRQLLALNKSENINKDRNEKIFTRSEVSKHDSLEKGVWITYRGNVYDITEFIRHHPGGSHTILMGAGGDVEPFWQTYTVHNAQEVQNLLATYKIGIISPEEQEREKQLRQQVNTSETDNNPYANDPIRSPILHVLTETPFNAETPGKLLTPTYLTPVDIFFVRNHLPVPEVDLEDYALSICTGTDGDLDNLKVIAEFTLDELRTKFTPHTVDSVIQCSGNRRSDLKKVKEIKGLNWQVGAMGNARWTGVRLIDLLDSIGVKRDDSIKHVQLEGLDCDMTGQSYGSSVSADVVFDANKEVILAYEMNGRPLTRDHGFPLRFIAPGVTGARNVKWLGKIILSHEESNSHWQRKDYKSFSPNIDMFNVNFDQSISIQETPVQSAICDPSDGDQIVLDTKQQHLPNTRNTKHPLTIPIKGYAYSGGGKMIIRVDVSIDGGKNWKTADLIDIPRDVDGSPDYNKRNQIYSWTRWVLDVPIPEDIVKSKSGSIDVICRAFDSSYNSQPERPDSIWNVRGVVNNSWHKIKLNVSVN